MKEVELTPTPVSVRPGGSVWTAARDAQKARVARERQLKRAPSAPALRVNGSTAGSTAGSMPMPKPAPGLRPRAKPRPDSDKSVRIVLFKNRDPRHGGVALRAAPGDWEDVLNDIAYKLGVPMASPEQTAEFSLRTMYDRKLHEVTSFAELVDGESYLVTDGHQRIDMRHAFWR